MQSVKVRSEQRRMPRSKVSTAECRTQYFCRVQGSSMQRERGDIERNMEGKKGDVQGGKWDTNWWHEKF